MDEVLSSEQVDEVLSSESDDDWGEGVDDYEDDDYDDDRSHRESR